MMEPDAEALGSEESPQAGVDTHGMNPMNVLRMAGSMGAPLKGILLVGANRPPWVPEEGKMGLSEPVENR